LFFFKWELISVNFFFVFLHCSNFDNFEEEPEEQNENNNNKDNKKVRFLVSTLPFPFNISLF
jgi:hypothetical protein